jgi:hypothetical protein
MARTTTVPMRKKAAARKAKRMAGNDTPKISPADLKAGRSLRKIYTRWQPLTENRFERKRKLLPNLQLKYPSDDEILHLSRLMKVGDPSWLKDRIFSIILDAHLNHAAFQGLSIPQVRKACKEVASRAVQLRNALTKLDVGRGAKGSLDRAGVLIERASFLSISSRMAFCCLSTSNY